MILNIERVNKFINYVQFIIKSFPNVMNLKLNIFMLSIDWKYECILVAVYLEHQNYLTFFLNELFQLSV